MAGGTRLSSEQRGCWKAGGTRGPADRHRYCGLAELWQPSKKVHFLRADLEVWWLGIPLSVLLLRLLYHPAMTCFCNILSPGNNNKEEREVQPVMNTVEKHGWYLRDQLLVSRPFILQFNYQPCTLFSAGGRSCFPKRWGKDSDALLWTQNHVTFSVPDPSAPFLPSTRYLHVCGKGMFSLQDFPYFAHANEVALFCLTAL